MNSTVMPFYFILNWFLLMKLFLFLWCSLMITVNTSFKLIGFKEVVDETKNRDLKILVISDLNAAYGDTTYSEDVSHVIGQINRLKPDLVLCGGDMVAGQKKTIPAERTHAMWRNFKKAVLQPIADLKIPFGFTLGNHDASPNFIQDREIAQQFWENEKKMTGLTFIDDTNYPFYFSYLKNNVMIITWDAAGAQVKPAVFSWLKEQLESKIAKRAQLRILLGHLPLYAIVASKNKPGEVNSNPDSALAFFKKYKVDLYISGHQHAYFPAHKDGVQLLNLGCIGDGPRPILGAEKPATKAFTLIQVSVKSPQQFKYTTFIPNGNQELKLESLPDSVIGFNGVIKRRDIN
jgi:predicted MPP superfamily phosphohydrolase